MKVVTTVGELLDRWLWIEACEELGLDDWEVDEEREVILTEEQAISVGLLPMR